MPGFDPEQLRDFLGRWALSGGGVRVQSATSRLHVSSPYDKSFIASVKGLGGTWNPSKKTWSVPADKGPELSALLDRTYGAGASGASPGPSVALADMPKGISITRRGSGDVQFRGPYNNDFRLEAKKIGRWDGQSKAWVFPGHRQADVEKLARKHYGTTVGTPDAKPSAAPTNATRRTPADKLVARAAHLAYRFDDAGGHWPDVGMNRMPTPAEMRTWDSREVLDLINALRDPDNLTAFGYG